MSRLHPTPHTAPRPARRRLAAHDHDSSGAHLSALTGDERDRSWAYRPALDGLRAVAVWMVVAYHAGVDRLSSGFIGVDLFFILSGFVVTNAVLVDLRRGGSLRLGHFYSRRIRRLMPAAVVAVVGTCLIYLLTFSLVQRLQIRSDAQASLLYIANWHAIARSSDYFAAGDDASPFLHFWSLAIEEQFYVLFPIIAILVVRAQRRTNRVNVGVLVMASLGVVSLGAQLMIGDDDASRAYYGTDTRLFQLLVGCALAYVLANRPTVRVRRWIPAIGSFVAFTAFVVIGTDLVEMTASARGAWAAAVAGVLLLTLELDVSGPVAQLLARPTILYFGTISYGIYLWHWPLILAFREVADLSATTLAVVAGVTASALAALSYQILEDPIRRSTRLVRHPRLVIGVGLLVPVAIAFSVVPWILESDRRPQIRTDTSVTAVATGTDRPTANHPVPAIDFEAIRGARVQSPRCEPRAPETCRVRTGTGDNVVLIGDSHAQMYLPALERVAARHDWTLSANVVAGCPWQIGLRPRSDQDPEAQERCAELRLPWYETDLVDLDPDVILLAGRSWADESIARVIRADDPELADASLDEIHRLSSEETIALIQRSTDAEIVFFEPTPLAESDPLSCLSAAESVEQCVFTTSESATPEDVALRSVAEMHDGVTTVDFDRIVCPDEPRCAPVIDATPVWRDDHHLTIVFVQNRAQTIERVLFETGAFRARTE